LKSAEYFCFAIETKNPYSLGVQLSGFTSPWGGIFLHTIHGFKCIFYIQLDVAEISMQDK